MICPFAVQRPGPVGLYYAARNRIEGVIEHSAEGDWSAYYKPTDTMRQRRVSWPFSIYKDGLIEQHYPLDTTCWHAGNTDANHRLVGVEHEGTGPLTEAQIVSSVRLTNWIAEQGGFTPRREQPGRTLHEHNEISGTTCPNGRIPWDRYEEEDVQVKPLDVSESIQSVQAFVAQSTDVVADREGSGMYEIVSGFPNAKPTHRYIVLELKK